MMGLYNVNGKMPIAAWIPTRSQTAEDLIGTNDGTLTNGAAIVAASGAGGTHAFSFAGSTEFVTIADDALLDLESSFAISFWLYLNSNTNGSIISKFGAATQIQRGFRVESAVDYLYLTENSTNRKFVIASTLVGTWANFVLSVNSSKLATLYQNNTSLGTATIGGSFFNTPNPLRFGAPISGFFNSGTTAFDGKLDDIRMFDQTLDASDVSFLWSGGDGRGVVNAQSARFTGMKNVSSVRSTGMRNPSMRLGT